MKREREVHEVWSAVRVVRAVRAVRAVHELGVPAQSVRVICVQCARLCACSIKHMRKGREVCAKCVCEVCAKCVCEVCEVHSCVNSVHEVHM